ncbi:FecR family protein [Butyricimonas sp. Marseille-P3923]|uniref:FecR family protein n=1 Tax=Butyricimonas sp. Marseille-P3923 TaxID=1987504 RepID=UPI000C07AFDD|nr:FecR family protein [Butyricimonas sp. Marseille-P3923]
MDNSNYRIVELIQRYFAEDLDAAEREELEKWLATHPEDREMFEKIREGKALEAREVAWDKMDRVKALRQFERKVGYRKRSLTTRVMKYAAVIMIPLLGVLAWNLTREVKQVNSSVSLAIVPGASKAVLILEDGEEVALESMEGDRLDISQSGVRVQSMGSGIVYSDTVKKRSGKSFNRLNTPRGGEYNVILADGTRVYLNAASSLKYPVVFDEKERTVYLSGEAYFDVAKDAKRPFYVITDVTKLEVYGTSFNVNTRYGNGVQTVLVSGSIGVEGRMIKRVYRVEPSELIEFSSDGEFVKREKVDVAPYVAWRYGQFMFENESLEHIMNTLSLWYDVDVFYSNESVKKHRFTGHMKKYEDIDTILDAISKIMGVTFIIKDKTITVME